MVLFGEIVMLLVNALAGVGKTSVVCWGLGVKVPTNIQISKEQLEIVKFMRSFKWNTCAAMAFNRSIADELVKRLDRISGVECTTSNGFGFRNWKSFVAPNKVELNANKLFVQLKAKLEEDKIPYKDYNVWMNDVIQVIRTIKYNITDFSAYEETVDICDVVLDVQAKTYCEWLYSKSKDSLTYIDFDDQLYMPYIYDVPIAQYDLVVVDESQDLSRAKQWLAQKMARKYMVCIGDANQCQPGDTKVTICHKLGDRWHSADYITKFLKDIKPGDKVVAFNNHERAYVNRAEVLQVSQRTYSGKLLHITTEEGNTTKCTPNHKFLVKWIKNLPTELWCTYIMRKGDYYRVGWCQVFTVGGGFHLGMRARLEDADAAWIISIHTTKAVASFTEQKIALQYGIPTVMFLEANGNYIYSQDNLDAFWTWTLNNLNIDFNVITLFEELGLSKDMPFYTKGTNRKKGRTTCFELEAANMLSIQEYIELPSTANLSSSRGQLFTKVILIASSNYIGTVYSLEVDKYGTYIADDVCTHNSIYGFSGADCNSMDTMGKYMSDRWTETFQTMSLTVTRRCPKTVVAVANKYVPTLKAADEAPDGQVLETPEEEFGVLLIERTNKCMVLCRTNAPLMSLAFYLIRNNRPCYIQGKDIGSGLVKLLKNCKGDSLIDKLLDLDAVVSKKTLVYEEKGQMDKAELLRDKALCIRTICDNVTTMDEFKDRITKLFKDSGNTNEHQLCSVHKSKGLEHDWVCIYKPSLLPLMLKPRKGKKVPKGAQQQEFNLAYVGITRAMNILEFVIEPKKKK